MSGYVIEDCVGEIAVVALAGGDARDLAVHFFADGCGADVDVEAREEMEGCGGACGVVQCARSQFDGGDRG